jgi:hypothetical protein
MDRPRTRGASSRTLSRLEDTEDLRSVISEALASGPIAIGSLSFAERAVAARDKTTQPTTTPASTRDPQRTAVANAYLT